jgi:outer membrane protein assembly factor BamD (BamD/ComL family)
MPAPRTWLLLCCLLTSGLHAADDAELAQQLMKRAQHALVNGEHEDALRRFQTIAKLYPRTTWAETAWWQIARLEEHLGEVQAAFDALQVLVVAHVGQFAKAHAEQFRLARSILDDGEQRTRKQGLEARRPKARDESEQEMLTTMLETVVKNGPQSEAAIQAQHALALMLERAGKMPQALVMHEDFLEDHATHELADDAACQVAYIRYKHWKTMRSDAPRERDSAKDALVWFLSRYPHSEKAALAHTCLAELKRAEQKELESLARYYEGQGKPDAAAIYYRQLGEKFPELARLASPLRQKIIDAVQRDPSARQGLVGPTAPERH